jgi:hypothetical protein
MLEDEAARFTRKLELFVPYNNPTIHLWFVDRDWAKTFCGHALNGYRWDATTENLNEFRADGADDCPNCFRMLNNITSEQFHP